jgi:hydroxymethylbilane synthase
MLNSLILGTRGSALALAQTELTKTALKRAFPSLLVSMETFITQGDRKLDLELLRQPSGGKGLFTKELEDALFERRIEVAVHSLKDLPGNMPEGLVLGGVLERAATADMLISKYPGGLDGLPHGSSVGTSSVRRARQLNWLRPDLRVSEWRGNVQTRLRKLGQQGAFSGILLAQAGLDRLGFSLFDGQLEFESTRFYVASLEDRMFPAIGQGAIALQCETERAPVRETLRAITHEPTWTAIRAERELQRLLSGDCTLPVGVRTRVGPSSVRMEALLFEDGQKEPAHAKAEGAVPEEVAALVARGLGVDPAKIH